MVRFVTTLSMDNRGMHTYMIKPCSSSVMHLGEFLMECIFILPGLEVRHHADPKYNDRTVVMRVLRPRISPGNHLVKIHLHAQCGRWCLQFTYPFTETPVETNSDRNSPE